MVGCDGHAAFLGAENMAQLDKTCVLFGVVRGQAVVPGRSRGRLLINREHNSHELLLAGSLKVPVCGSAGQEEGRARPLSPIVPPATERCSDPASGAFAIEGRRQLVVGRRSRRAARLVS